MSTATGPAPAVPLIGFGQVRHSRLRPRRHAFAYRSFFLMLPMRRLQAHPSAAAGLALNRAAALSFHDADHGDGRGPQDGGALAWIDELLRREGINDACGEVWLHCYPRVFGYAFKPVSFWYCHRSDGSLRTIVVEVNNTFGGRHCYLLDKPRYGASLSAEKVFPVSPFCETSGSYRFVFMRSVRGDSDRCLVRIDHHDAAGLLLQTSVSGELLPVSPQTLRRAFWAYPAMSLAVIVHIHWQALRLWLKRVPLQPRPRPSTPSANP
jgi:DUF1365 family protein